MEHRLGTPQVFQLIYQTWWFNALLAAIVLAGGIYIVKIRRLYRRFPVFLFHFALIVVLAGASLTRLTGKTGTIHLREQAETLMYYCDEDKEYTPLPFALRLRSFRVECYPGTDSPANYISNVQLIDKEKNRVAGKEISMNKVLNYRGYRFYQSSFDEDGKGSVLSVNRDAAGTAVTYIGYALLFLSMLWILADRRGRFVFLLKKFAAGSLGVAALFALSAQTAEASSSILSKDGATLNREQSDRFARLWVNHQGRICPLQTQAIDFAVKLTGKPSYKYADATQVLLGWLFFPDKWQHVPLFEVKHPELQALIHPSGKACFADFFTTGKSYRLESYHKQILDAAHQTAAGKEAAKLDEKVQLIAMLQQGAFLPLFPLPDETNAVRWYAATDSLPAHTGEMEKLFVRHFFPMYYEHIRNNEPEKALRLIDKLAQFQRQQGASVLPSQERMNAELFYNQTRVFSWLFKINLTVSALGMFFFLLYAVRRKDAKAIHRIFYALLSLSFLAMTAGMALRGYISGRLPMSNGYETMLFIAWTVLLIGLLCKRYPFVLTVFSLLLSGFTLLVAHIGAMNPSITPLVPVLQSPLLSVHVSLIMISYGFCGFMVLNSLTAFVLALLKPRSASASTLKELSELFMYPAAFFMGAGIFVGAIWANVSWGRYWGWDPKEVWALITFLLMSFSFHGKTLRWFERPLFYHFFALLVFASVLMTYFGVNYLLGGMHSYGG